MLIHQALFFTTALGLHAGFGLSLGILALGTKQRGFVPRWVFFTFTFFWLIYLPSALVILGSNQLSAGIRGLILSAGVLTIVVPFLLRRWRLENLDSTWLWQFYPAVCMLLLMAWSCVSLYINWEISGALLALGSAVAALAVLQRQYQPG